MTTTINGTLGVSLVQDASITTAKLVDNSVTQAKQAPNVAGNGPCFSAYQSTAQTVPASTLTKIQYQAKEFDTTNAFDAVTNSRFQPLVAGYYQVTGAIQVSTSWTGGYLNIQKNGGLTKQGPSSQSSSTTAGAFNVTALIYLNGTTDYVEIAGFIGVAQALVTGIAGTYFQAFLARSA